MLETQQKRKPAPAAHFDASPDESGEDQSKQKAKTAALLVQSSSRPCVLLLSHPVVLLPP